MQKDGKSLENLVKLIHEALKENPNTVITSNYKIESLSKTKREIDVLVEAQVNGIEIKIAIECKDYSRAVGIEKMDAFKAKCDSIPAISKKIFVSKSGYTSGAIKNAEIYGIELYELTDLNKDSVLSWFPKMAKWSMTLEILNIIYGMDEKLSYTDEDIVQLGTQIFLEDKVICDDVMLFAWEEVAKRTGELRHISIIDFLRYQKDVIRRVTLVPPAGAYVFGENQRKIGLKELWIEVKCGFVESPTNIIEASAYGQYQNEETQVQRISFDMGEDVQADMIRVKDGEFQIFVQDNGETTQLQTLGIYDPQDGTFTRLGE
jgi:hypothetical protein